jgi:hypothetical protein
MSQKRMTIVRRSEQLRATFSEPEEDILAQLCALTDPTHPKDVIFLAPTNAVPENLPPHVSVVRRPEGSLLTTNKNKASVFQNADELHEADMAALLGFPESKCEACASGAPLVVVQARNEAGAVGIEMLSSLGRISESVLAASKQMPYGGMIVFLSVRDALLRRVLSRMGRDNG